MIDLFKSMFWASGGAAFAGTYYLVIPHNDWVGFVFADCCLWVLSLAFILRWRYSWSKAAEARRKERMGEHFE